MKRIVAINASPRKNWNTGMLVRDAASGAESAGAEVTVFDLYSLEKFTGCVSCFGCKLGDNFGKCVRRDGLTPVLDAIRGADGLIIGSPNYLGDVTAAFRALYERLVFQSITYKKEQKTYNGRPIPVLFIMTSNLGEEVYEKLGYSATIANYKRFFGVHVGPMKVLISGDTLQVNDYEKYDWTVFDAEAKKARREEVFPQERHTAHAMGVKMIDDPWHK